LDVDSKEWLADFCRINAFDISKRTLDGRRPARRITSKPLAQAKLGAILRADPLAVRVTHRRLRAGIPVDRISRD
jgi:hypothetical protein